MPLPPYDRIRAIGEALRNASCRLPVSVERIVVDRLGMDGPLAGALLKGCA